MRPVKKAAASDRFTQIEQLESSELLSIDSMLSVCVINHSFFPKTHLPKIFSEGSSGLVGVVELFGSGKGNYAWTYFHFASPSGLVADQMYQEPMFSEKFAL